MILSVRGDDEGEEVKLQIHNSMSISCGVNYGISDSSSVMSVAAA